MPPAQHAPGTPPWMPSLKEWATRNGSSPEPKRATIEVRVPAGERPWEYQALKERTADSRFRLDPSVSRAVRSLSLI
jgi:hypothetical protein